MKGETLGHVVRSVGVLCHVPATIVAPGAPVGSPAPEPTHAAVVLSALRGGCWVPRDPPRIVSLAELQMMEARGEKVIR
jgi:hypothetical protein